MLRKKICVITALILLGYSIFGTDAESVSARKKYFLLNFLKKEKRISRSIGETTPVTETEPAAESETAPQSSKTHVPEAKEETQPVTEEVTEVETQPVTEPATESETEPATEPATEVETEPATEPVTEISTESSTEAATSAADTSYMNERISYYGKIADEECAWLWSQQMSNGAFAFYNADNGTVYINPYFSEVTAIALINHDNSPMAQERIIKYFEWHFSHINTAESDYNGLAGTIYDYNVEVKDGVVIKESSKGSYDSTDSYSALFIKALADYSRVFGDTKYLIANEDKIKDITNVMFATMNGGYTYAKPDYRIRYLMDNAEVYAGLKSAEYIYRNIINDSDMYEKVSKAVKFYDDNFNKDWWKGDHYATVLNSDNSEYTGIEFSWDNFYPCATSQMFPVLYGLIDSDSTFARTIYDELCKSWNWQDMDYVSNGTTVFCWGNFAYYAGLMEDESGLERYLDKYRDIVNGGRKYPLYSSESAMVLMGCDEIMDFLR